MSSLRVKVVPAAVIGVLLAAARVDAAPAQSAGRGCPALPPTVTVDPMLQPAVRTLIDRSATFRRQCALITAQSTAIRIQVHLVPRLQPSTTLAKATVKRYAFGRLSVNIEIGLGGPYTELLAHEFEHVAEQIERIDLAARDQARSGAVTRLSGGAFETARARDAGRAAASEVDGDADPTVTAAADGLARMARTTWRMLASVKAVAPNPAQFHQK